MSKIFAAATALLPMSGKQAASSRSQRWRNRRMSMTGNNSVIDPAIHSVDVVSCHHDAKPFVLNNHYSGSFPASRLSCGLFRNDNGKSQLVGIACFSVSMNPKAAPRYTGLPCANSVELGRLVLLDNVEGNGESWFMARAMKLLRAEKPDVEAVYAYSDPVPRTDESGAIIMPGHIGQVYQALNATCRGRSSARTLHSMPNGRILSGRAMTKLRKGEQGVDYVIRDLEQNGAPERNLHESGSDWLQRLQAEGFLSGVKHPGNWVYSFPLTRGARKIAQNIEEAPRPLLP